MSIQSASLSFEISTGLLFTRHTSLASCLYYLYICSTRSWPSPGSCSCCWSYRALVTRHRSPGADTDTGFLYGIAVVRLAMASVLDIVAKDFLSRLPRLWCEILPHCARLVLVESALRYSPTFCMPFGALTFFLDLVSRHQLAVSVTSLLLIVSAIFPEGPTWQVEKVKLTPFQIKM